MKILSVNDMLDVAADCRMPNFAAHCGKLEQAAQDFAEVLAEHLGVITGDSANYDQGCGGLCATFRPARRDQPCPEVIDAGDPGGDWED